MKRRFTRCKNNSLGRAYCGMIICKGIVDAHILKEPANMSFKESFYLFVIILRVNKDSANVSFNNVGKSLVMRVRFLLRFAQIASNLGSKICICPVITRTIFFQLLQFCHVFSILSLNYRATHSDVPVKLQFGSKS